MTEKKEALLDREAAREIQRAESSLRSRRKNPEVGGRSDSAEQPRGTSQELNIATKSIGKTKQ